MANNSTTELDLLKAVTTSGGATDTIAMVGTVAANQGGTWTVQPGNTANTTAWKVDGSAVTQPVSGTVTATSIYSTRSDTYTGAGNGTTVSVPTTPLRGFTIVVKGTGASATTWDIRLEGSLDNVNFTQILQHTNTTGDGVALFSGASLSPCLYFRSRCSGLVLGGATNAVVTILGVG